MKIARVISRLFEPQVIAFILVLGAGLKSGLQLNYLIGYLMGVVILFLLIWKYRLIIVARNKNNWDLNERKDRVKPLFLLIIVLALTWLLISRLVNSSLTQTYEFFLVWAIGFWLITLFYKISGHAAVLTLAVGLAIQWFGLSWWPISLLIIPVAWSRYQLRAHSLGQLTLGVVYSTVLFLIFP